jgi:hypothetical protein
VNRLSSGLAVRGVTRWPAAGPPTAYRVATRRAARLPDREADQSSSRPGRGTEPASGDRGRGLSARRAVPNSVLTSALRCWLGHGDLKRTRLKRSGLRRDLLTRDLRQLCLLWQLPLL